MVSYDLQKAIESTPQLLADNESTKIYFKDGKALSEYSLMQRPDLAKTLIAIANNGSKGFYEGEVAKKIVKAMNANNGFITLNDLKNYKINAGAPIAVPYRGNTVFAPGAPSGGGVVLLTALNILQNYKFKDQDSNATRTYHLLAESLRRGHNNRSHHIGDPAFYDVPTEKLLSRARTVELLKNFKFLSFSDNRTSSLVIFQSMSNSWSSKRIPASITKTFLPGCCVTAAAISAKRSTPKVSEVS